MAKGKSRQQKRKKVAVGKDASLKSHSQKAKDVMPESVDTKSEFTKSEPSKVSHVLKVIAEKSSAAVAPLSSSIEGTLSNILKRPSDKTSAKKPMPAVFAVKSPVTIGMSLRGRTILNSVKAKKVSGIVSFVAAGGIVLAALAGFAMIDRGATDTIESVTVSESGYQTPAQKSSPILAPRPYEAKEMKPALKSNSRPKPSRALGKAKAKPNNSKVSRELVNHSRDEKHLGSHKKVRHTGTKVMAKN